LKIFHFVEGGKPFSLWVKNFAKEPLSEIFAPCYSECMKISLSVSLASESTARAGASPERAEPPQGARARAG